MCVFLPTAWEGLGEKKAFFQRLREAGGKVTVFYPPLVPYINFRINFRNHRKLVIIDGKVGYVGGFNVGDEYVGKGKHSLGVLARYSPQNSGAAR